MKMKYILKNLVQLIIGLIFMTLIFVNSSYAANEGLIFDFNFDGNNVNVLNPKSLMQPVEGLGLKYEDGIDGKKNGAITFAKDPEKQIFEDQKIKERYFASIPLDENTGYKDKVTISFWMKVIETDKVLKSQTIFKEYQEYRDDGMNFKIDSSGNLKLYCGTIDKDIKTKKPEYNEWIFITIVYDGSNEEVRFIRNNEVFKSRARFSYIGINNENRAIITCLDGIAIDNLKIYNRLLNLDEIESLYGKKIDLNRNKFEIKERYATGNGQKDKRAEFVKVNNYYFCGHDNFDIKLKMEDSSAVVEELSKGDKVKITEIVVEPTSKDKYCVVETSSGKKGYITFNHIFEEFYSEGEGSFGQFKRNFMDDMFLSIFFYNGTINWMMLGSIFFILFICNFLLIKFFKFEIKKTAANFAPGSIFGIGLLQLSVVNINDAKWFLTKGINVFKYYDMYDRNVYFMWWGLIIVSIVSLEFLCHKCLKKNGINKGLVGCFILIILNIVSIIGGCILLFIVLMLIYLLLGLLAALGVLSSATRTRYVRKSDLY